MFDALFGDNAAWFGLPAVLGTIFFLIRFGFLLIGGDSGGVDADLDLDLDLDVDMDTDAGHGDPGEAMKVLSVQSIATFAT